MARRKSVRDIINQRNRIQMDLINNNPLGAQTRSRYRRVVSAAERYVANVESKYGSTLTNNRWNKKADIRVSRSTYMGLNAG